jgi:hypothetical protein
LERDGNGVQVTSIAANSDAARRGMVSGDVISRVQDKPVVNPAEVQFEIDAMRAMKRDFVLLLVLPKVRNVQGPKWVPLRLGPAADSTETVRPANDVVRYTPAISRVAEDKGLAHRLCQSPRTVRPRLGCGTGSGDNPGQCAQTVPNRPTSHIPHPSGSLPEATYTAPWKPVASTCATVSGVQSAAPEAKRPRIS